MRVDSFIYLQKEKENIEGLTVELLSWPYDCINCFQDAEKYKLGHPSHFHYLNQSKIYELEGVSSAEEYMKTRRAMDIVGISHVEQV